MLQATLEFEYFHQAVGNYVNASANDMLNKVYEVISQSYRRQKSHDEFQTELESLRKVLHDAQRATGVETLCFKQKRPKAERERSDLSDRERERPSTGSRRPSATRA